MKGDIFLSVLGNLMGKQHRKRQSYIGVGSTCVWQVALIDPCLEPPSGSDFVAMVVMMIMINDDGDGDASGVEVGLMVCGS